MKMFSRLSMMEMCMRRSMRMCMAVLLSENSSS